MEGLKLNLDRYRQKWEIERDKNDQLLIEEDFHTKVREEEDIKAPEITEMLCSHLTANGFLTVKERNYIGENIAPFDIAAGDPTNLKIYGFEVKSDKDSFERLKTQLQHYAFVCEEIYIVLHKLAAPEWLPDWCGIIRVSTDGEILIEKISWHREPFQISTNFEWKKICKENNLGGIQEKLSDTFKEIMMIRKNILFNRYFAEVKDPYGDFKYSKFFPFTEEQKKMIIGFDVPYHLKNFHKELTGFEKRFKIIKEAINLGESKKK